MAKKILLVESDADFAREMASALERRGFESRTTGDGKEGLDLARDERPEAIVLCVELPKMSGYSICAKLKKDEALKSIPVVIISAEATPETFEQHKQLKTRAEDYLLKPFEPAQLVERLAALVGLPPASAPDEPPNEEVVTLADVELEALGDPASDGATLDLAPASTAPPEDEDLRLLDNAFESIAAPAPDSESAAMAPADDGLSFGGLTAPPPDPLVPPEPADEPAPAFEAGSGKDEDAALLAALGSLDHEEPLIPPPPADPSRRPIRGANLNSLRAAGIPVLDPPSMAAPPMAAAFAETSSPRAPTGSGPPRELATREQTLAAREELAAKERELAGRDAELRQTRERFHDLEVRLARTAADLARVEANLRSRESELSSIQTRLESRSASADKLEADLRASRDEARHAGERARQAEQEAEQARERAQDAERALGEKAAEVAAVFAKLEASEQELESLRGDLIAAQNEAATARSSVEDRTGALQKRVQELEVASSKNEERVVKAYQKIKGDEKLREKTRKALTIALQLLDEHGPIGEPEKPRPASRE